VKGGRLSMSRVIPVKEFSAEKEEKGLICEDLRIHVTYLGNYGIG
jgi:hypothetical protein